MKKTYSLLLCTIMLTIGCTERKVQQQDIVTKSFDIAQAQSQTMLKIVENGSAMPNAMGADAKVDLTHITGWTSGFFSGCLWYIYDYTKSDYWREQAERSTLKLDSIQHFSAHHDVGFMMNCSYGNAYRLVGNKMYEQVLVNSAKSLSKRYIPQAKTIRSWDSKKSRSGNIWGCPVIMDNMLNLELLFLATKLTGDNSFREIAINHANSTMKNHLREDYSSYHVVNYDTLSGNVLQRANYQGYADNSTWSRGQAWGVYGFTMVYRETADTVFLTTAQRMAEYFISNIDVDNDPIPLWDFNAGQSGYNPSWTPKPETDLMKKDASAAAIFASALLELADYSPTNQTRYIDIATKILNKLASDEYLAAQGENANFILKHSVGNLPSGTFVDVPTIYADYYFLEALVRYDRKTGKRSSAMVAKR